MKRADVSVSDRVLQAGVAGLDKLTYEDRAALFLIRALHAALELRKEIRRADVVQGHRRSRDREKNTTSGRRATNGFTFPILTFLDSPCRRLAAPYSLLVAG